MTTKEKILEKLSQAQGQAISGQTLAEDCGVSRAAVWKAVQSLREKGCKIEGTTNGGYIMTGDGDLFSQELFEKEFYRRFPEFSEKAGAGAAGTVGQVAMATAGEETSVAGRATPASGEETPDLHIECFSEIDSTNTYAKRLLTEAGSLRLADGSLTPAGEKFHKSIIIAEKQTAGRGRLGRTFYSPAKSGIYLSLIYAPKGGITKPARVTALAAVAVCRAIKKVFGVDPSIKWINDIFINGKKVSGILTEGFTNFETGMIESAIIGIGVNISSDKGFFPEDVAKVAGAILDCKRGESNVADSVTPHNAGNQEAAAYSQNAGNQEADGATESPCQESSRCAFAAELYGQLLKVYDEDPTTVMAEYKAHSFLIGKTLDIHPIIGDEKSVYKAKAVDIDDQARLVVELQDGSRQALNAGEVTLRSENF